jgi:DNA-binding NarL/FixJ family response regulator
MSRIRIVIADDQGIVRKGLRLQLEQNADVKR